MSYYTYAHRAGYGRDDHMATELIARAARQLGCDTGLTIAQAAGYAPHSVPLPGVTVRLDSGPGVRRRMEAALKAARAELPRRPDLCVEVVLRRTRYEYEDRTVRVEGGYETRPVRVARVIEERHGLEWVEIERESKVAS